jgi:hypothetical protein
MSKSLARSFIITLIIVHRIITEWEKVRHVKLFIFLMNSFISIIMKRMEGVEARDRFIEKWTNL